MKKVDYSQTSVSDLKEKLKDDRSELNKMMFTHSISPMENPMRIPQTKKVIARVLTELRKRELAETKK